MKRRIAAAIGTVAFLASIAVYSAVGWDRAIPWGLAFLAGLVVGSLIAWKKPGNRIGYLLVVFGGGTWLGGLGPTLARVVENPVAAGWLDATGNALNTACVITLPAVLLFFPDGTLPGRRWKPMAWVIAICALVGASAAILNGGWGGDQNLATAISPLYEATSPAGDVLRQIFFPLFTLSFAVAAGSLVVRFRRAVGESRLQIKWLMMAGALLLTAVVAVVITSDFRLEGADELWEQTAISIGFAAIPAAIGVAVLKYRLYDIDVVISRTVALAFLATFITLVYALIVVGIGRLLGAESDGLALPIAATALVAIAFEPVRVRAQRWANRLVYGSRATPYEVLREITESMGRSGPDGDILARLAELLRDGTGAEQATVWLGQQGEMTPAALSPPDAEPSSNPSFHSSNVFPVFHDDEVVGALEVVKERGSAMSSSDQSLASDLAGSAGAVLGYQRLNQSLQQRATELEQSRSRLLGVQGNERRRLEQDLHEGAEQFIVALKVKLGVAARLADKHDADQLKTMLDGLTDEAQAALDDVQSLAKGIYPAVLQTDGLVSAISSLAASTPVEVEFQRDGVGRYPTDLEAAVYFGISEAVTNAVKHATPPIMITMEERDGILRFSVTDQGPGFEVDQANLGSGLENMADRLESVGGSLEVISSAGDRTEIRGEVPY